MTSSSKLHVHFDSRREADPIFHMTEDLCRAALARRKDLAGRVRMTYGWNLEEAPAALRTADMFVGFRMPKEVVRTSAPQLRAIHLIGAGVEHLRPLDWVPKQVAITNNRGIHDRKAGEYILLAASGGNPFPAGAKLPPGGVLPADKSKSYIAFALPAH